MIAGGSFSNPPFRNDVPKQMTRDEWRERYWNVVKRLYAPEVFLERYFKIFEFDEYLKRRAEICRKAGEGKSLPTLGYGLILLWSFIWALFRDGSLCSVGRCYLKNYLLWGLKHGRGIIGLA